MPDVAVVLLVGQHYKSSAMSRYEAEKIMTGGHTLKQDIDNDRFRLPVLRTRLSSNSEGIE